MPIAPISDHAERSGALLPAQHARANWDKLLRAVLGARGLWSDGDPLWAIRSTTKGTIALPESELALYFGVGGAATILAGGFVAFDVGEHTLKVSALSSPPAFVLTDEELDAAILAQTLLLLAHSALDEQIVEEVTAALASAPRGLQEVEGAFAQLCRLRNLRVAAGAQLDGIGELLTLARGGRVDDPDYRDALRLQAAANAGGGTIPGIVDSAALLSDVVFAQLLESFPAHLALYLHGTTSTAGTRAILRKLKAAGVAIDIVSAGGTLPFVFGPDAGWNLLVGVVGDVYTVQDDVTGSYAPGDEVRVWDVVTSSVLHSTRVLAVAFVGPDTEVTVLDGGGVTPTRVLENVTRGIQDEDGGPFEDAYQIVGFTGPATFRVAGNATSEFVGGGAGVGHAIRVTGSTGDDGVYRVLTVSFLAGQTRLAVTPTPPSGSGDGQLQHVASDVAESIDPAVDGTSSTHGEYADVFAD